MKSLLHFCIVSFFLFISCGSDQTMEPTENPVAEEMYFPPISGTQWESKTPASLNWNTTALAELQTYLQSKNTKSFMMLYNGRIVVEYYFDDHSSSTPWYWASAGKTLTSTVVGIAEQEGHLNINQPVSQYIGTGWTSAPIAKENLITSKNLLNMTAGLDDGLGEDVSPANLQYVADAGTRWAYHNVYVKLQDVVAQATGKTWDNYFNTALSDRIGMTGSWILNGNNSVFWSNTRSMARFGLLALNNGKWNGSTIVNPAYFSAAINTSQNINLAYGYLWWLNGKTSYHLPTTQTEFQGKLIPSAPNDLYCALGKNGQKIYVVPSKKLVVIRMGNSPDGNALALSSFDDPLWQKIMAVLP